MAKYRGSKGAVALGGIVTGSPLVNGARAQGVGTANIDGGSLTGVILKGDTFTVAGDAQVYTISADVLIAANAAAIAFTPNVVPGAGWADNAAITFTANPIAQVTQWEANPSRPVIDATVIGDAAKKTMLDTPMFVGRATCFFDYGDTRHAKAVDEATADGDIGDIGVVFTTATDKQLYGHVATSGAQIRSQRGQLVEVVFNFEGNGALSRDW